MHATPAEATLIADASAGAFAANFNRRSFLFDHRLAADPVFDLPNLVDLAARLRPDSYYYSTADARVDDGWHVGVSPTRSVTETLSGIAGSQSLVILKHVERDPEVGPFFRATMANLVAFAGHQLEADLVLGRVTVLITSPRRVTAYHMDAETNVLLQVRGSKTISVFDAGVVSDPELECFYAGDLNGAKFRPDLQQGAMSYRLVPGTGVHVPVNSPHWVQNDDNVSVSVSINFDLRSVARMAKVYTVNHYLRRAGMAPMPPGRSLWQDQFKRVLFGGLSRARRLKQ